MYACAYMYAYVVYMYILQLMWKSSVYLQQIANALLVKMGIIRMELDACNRKLKPCWYYPLMCAWMRSAAWEWTNCLNVNGICEKEGTHGEVKQSSTPVLRMLSCMTNNHENLQSTLSKSYPSHYKKQIKF